MIYSPRVNTADQLVPDDVNNVPFVRFRRLDGVLRFAKGIYIFLFLVSQDINIASLSKIVLKTFAYNLLEELSPIVLKKKKFKLVYLNVI